jgi:hypothetical protein
MSKLAIGTLIPTRLLAHGFSANLVLAGLADPALQNRRRLSARHTLFLCFDIRTLLILLSIEDFYLLGVLKDKFQPVLRMIFDESDDFNLTVLKLLERLFIFFK